MRAVKRLNRAQALANVVFAVTGRETVEGFLGWFDMMVTKPAEAMKALQADRDKWQLCAIGKAMVGIQERDKLKAVLEKIQADNQCYRRLGCPHCAAREALVELEANVCVPP